MVYFWYVITDILQRSLTLRVSPFKVIQSHCKRRGSIGQLLLVFTARRYAKARFLLSPGVRPSVRLSVRPSVTLVYCIQTVEDIAKLPSRPGRPYAPIPNSKGNPFSGGIKYKEGGKVLRFSTEIAVYLRNGTRYASGCYGTLIGSSTRSIERWHFQWPWRTANPVFKVTAYLKSNISKTVS